MFLIKKLQVLVDFLFVSSGLLNFFKKIILLNFCFFFCSCEDRKRIL
jgi:hypothetical protein